MNIEKCRTCKHFESFFNSCSIYIKEVYVDEGESDYQPVRIKDVSKSECKYRYKGTNRQESEG